jgi:hypothetical protein
MQAEQRWHNDLPDRMREYLHARGIPDAMIDLNLIGWNGWRITISIFNRTGELVFFKQARDPEDKSESRQDDCLAERTPGALRLGEFN